ncbi:hypothetical protein BDZ45DRAFT_708448 [Acephala macrosclerotiorum]|nr:hypothetical protein BDZ45DRAFT_708448 [Acephala macrosclerotiorum]
MPITSSNFTSRVGHRELNNGLKEPRQTNEREPSTFIYSKKLESDAPYAVSESDLLSALFIPSIFVYGTGKKQRAKLFAESSMVYSVELSIPGFTLDNIQVAVEYIAYAINYLSAVSGNKNVSVISWSQGSIDTQRAGGDSAYVLRTTIYSIFDEIAQPQEGSAASGHINDAQGVGVSNDELQGLCPDLLAGVHDDPRLASRINLATDCSKPVIDGISLADVLSTEGIIPIDAVSILTQQPRTFGDPAIMSYAA